VEDWKDLFKTRRRKIPLPDDVGGGEKSYVVDRGYLDAMMSFFIL
jgi:hypothetical protein